MKTRRFFNAIISISAAFALLMSCTPEDVVEDQNQEQDKPGQGQAGNPVFPDLVENYSVAPGETLTLSFVPDMDWTVSIPDESLQWFPIMDGTFKVSEISGKASSTPVSVTLKVSDVEEIGQNRSVDVSLTMGSKTQVIAKYMRPAKEASISVYAAKVENDEFIFAEDGSGNHAYEETEAEEINLIWPVGTNGFRTSIKVESNFEWIISLPEWAEADVPENTLGEVMMNIIGEPANYPLEGGEGKIQFKMKDQVVKEYTITIPPCNDKFGFTLSGVPSLIFNGDGEYEVAAGFEAAPARGTVFGPEDVKIFAIEKNESGYTTDEATWVNIKVADWDENGDVLQTRDVEYSVSVNEGEQREAAIFLLPATFTGSAADVLEGGQIKEMYMGNYISVVQYKNTDEFMIPLSNNEAMKSVGAYFSKISGGSIFNWFGETDYAYKMVYSVAWSLDEGWLYLKRPFATYKIFDSDHETEMSADSWLSVEYTENRRSVRVVMDTEEATTGYVAFYDEEGNNMGVLRCDFDPTKAPETPDTTTIEFIGESAQYAEIMGASLVEVTEGELFDGWKEYGAPIYHLTYKTDSFPMRISLPTGTVYYMTNPYADRDYFRVNDMNYDENVGSFSYIDGGVDIYMSMPEGKTVSQGVIIFSTEKYNTTDKVSLVLVCTLDMSE